MSKPLMYAVPLFGRINPASTLMVVLFPAPFGPTINVICFGSACSEMPRRIDFRPKLFVMLCVEIMAGEHRLLACPARQHAAIMFPASCCKLQASGLRSPESRCDAASVLQLSFVSQSRVCCSLCADS